MRIGTNHGSLSDRIMNRYGDTPLGMVESALEFALIARDLDYHAFVFSMKSSNPKVMINAYRLLAARLAEEGDDGITDSSRWTEAGEGRMRGSRARSASVALARWDWGHDSGVVNGGQRARNPSRGLGGNRLQVRDPAAKDTGPAERLPYNPLSTSEGDRIKSSAAG